MINVEFHKLAEKELLDSRDYYDNLVPGLGKKFILEVEHLLKRITNNPFSFPIYFNNYKKALLRKFPYSIIYNNNVTDIFILAICTSKKKTKILFKQT